MFLSKVDLADSLPPYYWKHSKEVTWKENTIYHFLLVWKWYIVHLKRDVSSCSHVQQPFEIINRLMKTTARSQNSVLIVYVRRWTIFTTIEDTYSPADKEPRGWNLSRPFCLFIKCPLMTLSPPAGVTNGNQDSHGNLCPFRVKMVSRMRKRRTRRRGTRVSERARSVKGRRLSVISINGNSIYRSERLTATFPQIFATPGPH